MHQQLQSRNCQIIAVDNSEAMVKRLAAGLQSMPEIKLEVRCEDIRALEIENASVVVLNFTLQFIPVEDREALLAKIYRGILPGGLLILSEKLAFEDERQQFLQTEMHHLFKKMQGYSDMEISQKRTALENVLMAESFMAHQQRLTKVGFSSVELWFQYFNFSSMIALK